MKRTNKIRSLSTLLVVMLALFISALFAVPALASDEESPENTAVRIEMTPIKYEFDDNSGYKFNFNDVVTGYCNGINQMGTLEVEGSDIVKTSYNGVDAIAIKGGSAPVIKYKQNISSSSYDGYEWALSSDTFTSVAGVSTHTVGNGAIVIFKSRDNVNYEYVTNMVNINGEEITYQISSNDLANGCYFKILTVAEVYYSYISGYHTEYPNGWKKFWGYGGYSVPDYSNYYRNIGSAYTFFVGDDSCTATYNSSSSDAINFNENEALSEAEVEYLRSATSLTDGAVSFSDIKVDFCGISSNTVMLSYNGGEETPVKDGDVYSESGAYKFKVESIFGTVSERTIYIMDMGEDLGYSKIFKEGLCDSSVRMFDERFAVPCFMTGMEISFAEMPNSPGIYGTISYSDNGETTTVIDTLSGVKDGYSKVLTKEGVYIADLYSSNPETGSGDVAHYIFAFAISENRSYSPSVNYSLISSTARNILFSAKMTSVAVKTAGGGSYIYCYPSTEEYRSLAYELAEKVEMLSIETFTNSDGTSYWYYKSADNANIKTKYEGNEGKRLMFEVLSSYAKLNVNDIYVESNSEYAINPVDDIEALKRISETSIANDVKVVISESVKHDLLASELYLNGFIFKQVADYESAWVVATDLKTGEAYYIDYDTDLSKIFNSTTFVRIKESNWNGDTVYEAVYYAPEDNRGVMTIVIDGVTHDVSKESAGEVFSGKKISITKALDEYDSNAIITLKNTKSGVRKILLLSEVSDIALSAGEWEVNVTNRFSNVYKIKLIVTEELEDPANTNTEEGIEDAYVTETNEASGSHDFGAQSESEAASEGAGDKKYTSSYVTLSDNSSNADDHYKTNNSQTVKDGNIAIMVITAAAFLPVCGFATGAIILWKRKSRT